MLLIRASNKVAVDISFAGLPFEQKMIEHATRFEYSPDCVLLTCSAEDLVVLKAFADRPVDWMDIEGIGFAIPIDIAIEEFKNILESAVRYE